MKKILLFILLTSLSFHIKSQIISQVVETNAGGQPKLIEIYNNLLKKHDDMLTSTKDNKIS